MGSGNGTETAEESAEEEHANLLIDKSRRENRLSASANGRQGNAIINSIIATTLIGISALRGECIQHVIQKSISYQRTRSIVNCKCVVVFANSQFFVKL